VSNSSFSSKFCFEDEKLVLIALFLIRQSLSNKILELFGKREMNQNF
jgi:hypothetical protein